MSIKFPVTIDTTSPTVMAHPGFQAIADASGTIIALCPLMEELLPNGQFSYAEEIQKALNEYADDRGMYDRPRPTPAPKPIETPTIADLAPSDKRTSRAAITVRNIEWRSYRIGVNSYCLIAEAPGCVMVKNNGKGLTTYFASDSGHLIGKHYRTEQRAIEAATDHILNRAALLRYKSSR